MLKMILGLTMGVALASLIVNILIPAPPPHIKQQQVIVSAYTLSCNDNQHTCIATFSNTIEDVSYYSTLSSFIRNLPEDWTITLELQGHGGSVDSVLNLYNAIDNSDAMVITRATGPVYSAHAMLALSGKIVLIDKASFVMLHRPAVYNPLSGEYELPEIICNRMLGNDRGQARSDKCLLMMFYNSKIYNTFFNDKIKKFLTEKEINNYNIGKDIYITSEDLKNRLEKLQ